MRLEVEGWYSRKCAFCSLVMPVSPIGTIIGGRCRWMAASPDRLIAGTIYLCTPCAEKHPLFPDI